MIKMVEYSDGTSIKLKRIKYASGKVVGRIFVNDRSVCLLPYPEAVRQFNNVARGPRVVI